MTRVDLNLQRANRNASISIATSEPTGGEILLLKCHLADEGCTAAQTGPVFVLCASVVLLPVKSTDVCRLAMNLNNLYTHIHFPRNEGVSEVRTEENIHA